MRYHRDLLWKSFQAVVNHHKIISHPDTYKTLLAFSLNCVSQKHELSMLIPVKER
jgi:hypothetical protein